MARLSAEAFAAGTGAGGIGILELESAIMEGFEIIQFAARDVGSALGIDYHSDAGGFDQDIAI